MKLPFNIKALIIRDGHIASTTVWAPDVPSAIDAYNTQWPNESPSVVFSVSLCETHIDTLKENCA